MSIIQTMKKCENLTEREIDICRYILEHPEQIEEMSSIELGHATFNEINNQSNTSADIFGWTNSGVKFSEYENRKKAMYQAVHHELLASALVVKKGYEINPEFKIGCMCFFVPFYPYSCNPDDVITATACMHERYYFSDIHIRGHYSAFAKKEWEREGTRPDM